MKKVKLSELDVGDRFTTNKKSEVLKYKLIGTEEKEAYMEIADYIKVYKFKDLFSGNVLQSEHQTVYTDEKFKNRKLNKYEEPYKEITKYYRVEKMNKREKGNFIKRMIINNNNIQNIDINKSTVTVTFYKTK